MRSDPYNCPLKGQISIRTPISKMKIQLGVWGFIPSHFLAFLGARNVILRLHSWPTPIVTLALGL
jgi:hypothetical protein